MAHTIEKKMIKGLKQSNLTSTNFVIAHDSGNPNNVGPKSLDNEVSYMTGQAEQGGAFTSHWVGGGGRIIQLAEVGKVQWGAGPKANPYSYAHVELARTDNEETFKKDYAAYIWLLRKLATDAGLPKTLDAGTTRSNKGIKTHDWVSRNLGGTTHTDPYGYLKSWGISKAQFKKDIENGLDGEPELSTSKPSNNTSGSKKSIDEVAREVLAGKWGNGNDRKAKLEAAGYNYEEVQTKVNASAVNKTPAQNVPTKSLTDIAREVLAGAWGNGDDRKKRLEARGYNFSKVQDEVNRLSGLQSKPAATKSINTVAKEVIAGKWGNGDARKKAIQNAGYDFNKVQAEVNRLSGAKSSPKLKSVNTVAKEVIRGEWGNGDDRRKRLERAGYNFNEVQKAVNKLL